MHLEYAAHVDHKISHSSSAGRVSLSLTGAAIAIVIVASGGAGAIALAGAAGLGGGLGMDFGNVVDHFLPPSASNKILTGLDSVRLGRQTKPAARAFPDTTTDCGHTLVEGSRVVVLGSECSPMSRRQDRDSGGGIVAEGLDDPAGMLIVGGDPSQQGVTISEDDTAAVKGLGLLFGILGLASSVGEAKTLADVLRAGAEGGALVASATDHGDTANVLGGLSAIKSPSNIAGGVSQAISGTKAASTAVGWMP